MTEITPEENCPFSGKPGWHLDKRVPLTLIAAIVIQTAALVWYAAKLDGRVIALAERVELVEVTNRRQYDRINKDYTASLTTANRLAKVEGLLESINGQVTSIVTHIMKQNSK